MRRPHPSVVVVLMALSCLSAAAQITVPNLASGATHPFVTSTGLSGTAAPGSSIALDGSLASVGSGCASRAAAPACQSYLPCGAGVNPASGFTIQFWFRMPAAIGGPNYLFSDASMVAPAAAPNSGGVFRCYFFSSGQLHLRGVPNQVSTAGTVFVFDTWTHVAYKYEPPPSNVLKCLINGAVVVSVAQTAAPFTWTGNDLTICGANKSSSPASAWFMDDIRVYGFARSDADIAADYAVAAAGNGPSGSANLPNLAYFDFESALPSHLATVGTGTDAPSTGARLATGGTLLTWDGDRPAGDLPASCLLEIQGPSFGNPAINPYAFAYRAPPPLVATSLTPGVPSLEVGHGYSAPANPFAIAWPDGLGLGFLPGLVFFAVPGLYTYQSSPPAQLVLPPNLLTHGDRIQQQWIALDPAYPAGLGVSDRRAFVYTDCAAVNNGPHAHVEARGVHAIHVMGFWEVHNTGTVDITRVVINLGTCVANGGTATSFQYGGGTNSGGTLAAGTAYRYQTDIHTGLLNHPPGYTGIGGGLQFDFSNFTACIDEFVFDCAASTGTNQSSGSAYIGATITVTFAGGAVSTGLLTADPLDPQAARVDL